MRANKLVIVTGVCAVAFSALLFSSPQAFALVVLAVFIGVGSLVTLMVSAGLTLRTVYKTGRLARSHVAILFFCGAPIFLLLMMPRIHQLKYELRFKRDRPGYEQWIADFEKAARNGDSPQSSRPPKDVLAVDTFRFADGRFAVKFFIADVGRIYSGYIYVPQGEPEDEVAKAKGQLLPAKAVVARIDGVWSKWVRF